MRAPILACILATLIGSLTACRQEMPSWPGKTIEDLKPNWP